MDKITYIHGRYGAEISFPSHQGEHGTCDFMTRVCARECVSPTNKIEIQSYKYFVDHNSKEIADRIHKEMSKIKAKSLSWFCESGDCPAIMTDKISAIMQDLSYTYVQQNGFTRNKKLWEKANDIQNCNVCLTIEDKTLAIELSNEGLTACPDYDIRRVSIYHRGATFVCGYGWVETLCGSGWAECEEEVQEEDCSLCCENSFGCYRG